ncbi:MAG: ABC transporter ATP-binding protein [bacterium]|nr:ABC transporter ATP-binding protein [bacterium]MDE0290045.1 ABC transporter ATP-binding protein [bacterium]MDE0439533.1 ABC transporter ATP-binding protein [bacterium]
MTSRLATTAADGTGRSSSGEVLLQLENLTHRYRAPRRQKVYAVEDLSLTVAPGEALGLVGESGCGKSTVARCVVGLIRPTAGRVIFDGTDVWAQPAKWRRRHFARQVAIVFQDPTSSLNPRLKVRDTLADPLIIHGIGDKAARNARVQELLDMVHLPRDAADKLPSELSGGQRQRVAIARALSLNPSLLVADEPTSALDVSVQNQILNLVDELRDALNLSVILISHNIQAVSWLVDRVAVMYLGHKVEEGPVSEVRDHRLHPYTRALLSASPMITRSSERIILEGTLPSPRNPPSGCPFRTRCWKTEDVCAGEFPPADIPVRGHEVHCYFPEDPNPV